MSLWTAQRRFTQAAKWASAVGVDQVVWSFSGDQKHVTLPLQSRHYLRLLSGMSVETDEHTSAPFVGE